MKKIALILSVALSVGCEKKDPTCVVCYVDGVEAVNICLEDYPESESVYAIRESIDPLLENEECHYYN